MSAIAEPMLAATNVRANQRTTGWMVTRTALYALALAITLFMLIPIYLIAISAFSPQADLFAYPKSLVSSGISAETMTFFLNARGVKEGLLNSVIVGLLTLTLSLLIGAPAGYALARFIFPGRDSFQLVILTTRAFPIVILAI
ncbi:MAG: carbohydrate ABC transporter permease, partial [Chloroflexi bacterium]|nr:carbohydrate ABC transporter permease [Chloroflexota bacterium]